MAAHSPLNTGTLASRTAAEASEEDVPADRVGNPGRITPLVRTALAADVRRGKSEGRPERGFVHEGQLPGLLGGRVTLPVAGRSM